MKITSIKTKTLLLMILLILPLFSACRSINTSDDESINTSDSIDVNKVTVAISSEPENGFDPTQGWGHGVTPLIQSTLLEYTSNMEIVNDLANNYTVSNDGLIWTFNLRTDAKYSDGNPVLATDVEYTFNTAKKSQSTLDLHNLENCKATGAFEVTFTLSSPNSTFKNTLASIGIVPKHAHNKDYANHPIGSGPWKLVQWKKGEQIILEANESYYGKVPSIKKVIIVIMDEDVAFTATQAKKVDVALISAINTDINIDGMNVRSITTADNLGLTLPTTPNKNKTTENGYPIGNDVTSNISIRKALAYCIDRDKVAKDAVNGYATPAYSENDGFPWNNPEVKIDTDVNLSKKILAEDGWKDSNNDGILEKGELVATFDCLYPSGDSVRQAVAMSTSEQAKNIGIDIQVKGVSWDDISKNMFSNAILMGWGSSNPYTSYLLFHSDNMLKEDYYNPEGFSNSIVDNHLDTAINNINTEKSYDEWKLAQWDGETGTSMKGDCPWVWIVNMNHVYYVNENLNIGEQSLHPHGSSWPLLQNLKDWTWE